MKQLYIKLLAFFSNIKSKIAFYPTILALAGFLLSFVMASFEDQGVSRHLIEVAPQLLLEDGDTALTVLSACIGGLISMMVFSFSMVMLLLSQASSNFSPRLLPGLISDKTHQIILGTYLATILYNIFTLFSIEPNDEKYTLPGLSILLGIALTILCLCLFIYFIHNISQSIQINNILDKIYEKSRKRMESLLENEKDEDKNVVENFPSTDNWFEYSTNESGYLQNISFKNITEIAVNAETRIHITTPKGFFVLKNACLIKSEKELDDSTLKKILSNINFSRGELVEDNYILAFKQVTEIAVKAMSPGINDPGTAINAIDYLTELFALRMKKRDKGILIKDDKAIVKIAIVNFEDLLYNTMAALRTYCKHDPIIVQKLIWMLRYLENINAYKEEYKTVVKKELKNLVEDALASFESEQDAQKIKALASLQ